MLEMHFDLGIGCQPRATYIDAYTYGVDCSSLESARHSRHQKCIPKHHTDQSHNMRHRGVQLSTLIGLGKKWKVGAHPQIQWLCIEADQAAEHQSGLPAIRTHLSILQYSLVDMCEPGKGEKSLHSWMTPSASKASLLLKLMQKSRDDSERGGSHLGSQSSM